MRQIDLHLHPAELGAVTARIRMAGKQLSVSIAAETPEAQRQLAAEGEKIRQALEALGFSVDQLSIGRADAAAGQKSEAEQQASAPQRGEPGSGAGGEGAGAAGGGKTGSNGGDRGGRDGGEAFGRGEAGGAGGGMERGARTADRGVYI